MAKRIQEQKGEEKIVAKSKPTLNLASLVSANSSTVQSPIALKSAGYLEQETSIKTQRRVLKRGKKMQFWMKVRGDS